jgi:hypothetical protein
MWRNWKKNSRCCLGSLSNNPQTAQINLKTHLNDRPWGLWKKGRLPVINSCFWAPNSLQKRISWRRTLGAEQGHLALVSMEIRVKEDVRWERGRGKPSVSLFTLPHCYQNDSPVGEMKSRRVSSVWTEVSTLFICMGIIGRPDAGGTWV